VVEAAFEAGKADVTFTATPSGSALKGKIALSLQTAPMVAVMKVKGRTRTVEVRRRVGAATGGAGAGAAAAAGASGAAPQGTAGAAQRSERGLWLYRDVSPGGIGVRAGPAYPGKRVAKGLAVQDGEVVAVCERVTTMVKHGKIAATGKMGKVPPFEVVFLRLASGKGWVFDRTNVRVLMVPYTRGWLHAPGAPFSTKGGSVEIDGASLIVPRFRVRISDTTCDARRVVACDAICGAAALGVDDDDVLAFATRPLEELAQEHTVRVPWATPGALVELPPQCHASSKVARDLLESMQDDLRSAPRSGSALELVYATTAKMSSEGDGASQLDSALSGALLQLGALRTVLEEMLGEGDESVRGGLAAMLAFANVAASSDAAPPSASAGSARTAAAVPPASAPAPPPSMSLAQIAMVSQVSGVLGGDTRKATWYLTLTEWSSAARAVQVRCSFLLLFILSCPYCFVCTFSYCLCLRAVQAAFDGGLPSMPPDFDPRAAAAAAAAPAEREPTAANLRAASRDAAHETRLNSYRLLKLCGQRQPLRTEQIAIAMLSAAAQSDVCAINELLSDGDALDIIAAYAVVLLHASRVKQIGRSLECVARLEASVTTLVRRRLRERVPTATDAIARFALAQSGFDADDATATAARLVGEQRSLLALVADSALGERERARLVGVVLRHCDFDAAAARAALSGGAVGGLSLSRFLTLADSGCLLGGCRLGGAGDALVDDAAASGGASNVEETSTSALERDVQRLAKALASSLASARAYAVLESTVASDAAEEPSRGESTASTQSTSSPASFRYDPRFLIFESVTGFLLRSAQIATIRKFVAARRDGGPRSFCVQQMIMGAGKTSVVGPICCMMLADMQSLVVSICPGSLLVQTRKELEKIFSAVLQKRVVSLVFRRADPRMRDATHIGRLHDKLQRARYEGSVVVATPDVAKSMVLQFVDLILGVKERAAAKPLLLTPRALVPSKATRAALAPAAAQLRATARAADALGKVLKLFSAAERGIALLDEVDLVLHPLRSELNYPVGEGKLPLPPTRSQPPHGQRWGIAMHILDPLFWAPFERHTLPDARPDSERDALEAQLADAVAAGIAATKLQASPHAVLLDRAFYDAELKPLWAHWALLWVLAQPPLDQLAPRGAGDALRTTMLAYLRGGRALSDEETRSLAALDGEAFELLNLARSWVDALLPHCFAKINRVKFGLLRESDVARFGGVANVNEARRLLAVPFVGKDAPSATSEFAHPDATIGLTVLAFRYDGLRRSDVVLVLRYLKDALEFEFGEVELRKQWQRWEEWKKAARSDLERALRAAEERAAGGGAPLRRGRSATARGARHVRRTFAERLDACGIPYGDPLAVPTLDLIEAANDDDVDEVWRALRALPELTHTYLDVLVFPRCTPHRPAKLSASGVDLGGGTLFGSCFGFSGTPSAMLPSALKPRRVVDMMESGSNAKMIRTLTDRSLTRVELLSASVARYVDSPVRSFFLLHPRLSFPVFASSFLANLFLSRPPAIDMRTQRREVARRRRRLLGRAAHGAALQRAHRYRCAHHGSQQRGGGAQAPRGGRTPQRSRRDPSLRFLRRRRRAVVRRPEWRGGDAAEPLRYRARATLRLLRPVALHGDGLQAPPRRGSRRDARQGYGLSRPRPRVLAHAWSRARPVARRPSRRRSGGAGAQRRRGAAPRGGGRRRCRRASSTPARRRRDGGGDGRGAASAARSHNLVAHRQGAGDGGDAAHPAHEARASGRVAPHRAPRAAG
jgi:hypothetical protein